MAHGDPNGRPQDNSAGQNLRVPLTVVLAVASAMITAVGWWGSGVTADLEESKKLLHQQGERIAMAESALKATSDRMVAYEKATDQRLATSERQVEARLGRIEDKLDRLITELRPR